MFFVARIQITKAHAWTPGERYAGADFAQKTRDLGLKRLADALDASEPAVIVGDRVPSLMAHADVRMCAACVEAGRPLDLTAMIKAVELGTRILPAP